jgi:hypothetical protein
VRDPPHIKLERSSEMTHIIAHVVGALVTVILNGTGNNG